MDMQYLYLFLFSVFLLATLIRLAPVVSLIDVPCARKQHDGAVPLVGGLAIYLALLLFSLLSEINYQYLSVLLVITTALVAISLVDDIWNIPYKIRLVFHAGAALAMVQFTGIQLDDLGSLSGSVVILGVAAVPFTVFATVGVINAMNFVDGADGLCGGLALISLAFMAYMASLTGADSTELLSVIMLLLFSFLLFNARWTGRKQAAVFLGDTGSVLLGFIIAWFLIDLSQGEERAFRPVTALWFFAVPLIDTVASILRRILHKRSPFSPDREHLHHILKRMGLSDNATVLVIYLVAISAGLAGLIGERFAIADSTMFIAFLASFGIYFFILMHAWQVVRYVNKHITPA